MKLKILIGLAGIGAGIGMLVWSSMIENTDRSDFPRNISLLGFFLIMGSLVFWGVAGLIDKDRRARAAVAEANTWIEQKAKQVSVSPSEAHVPPVLTNNRTGFNCPICNSDLQQKTNAPFKVTVGGEILECRNCGTVWSPASKDQYIKIFFYILIAAGVFILISVIAVDISNLTETPTTVNLGGVHFTNPRKPIVIFPLVPSLVLISLGVRGIKNNKAKILVKGTRHENAKAS